MKPGHDDVGPAEPADGSIRLVVRKLIRAPAGRVFDAWTRPDQLRAWWGPPGVTCSEAHVDLRPGGAYRIANRFEDGRVVWIAGHFESVERPSRLVYSWRLEGAVGKPRERVSVRFDRHAAGTEVVVVHERIGSEPDRVGHQRGWVACLEGLAAHFCDPGE